MPNIKGRILNICESYSVKLLSRCNKYRIFRKLNSYDEIKFAVMFRSNIFHKKCI